MYQLLIFSYHAQTMASGANGTIKLSIIFTKLFFYLSDLKVSDKNASQGKSTSSYEAG